MLKEMRTSFVKSRLDYLSSTQLSQTDYYLMCRMMIRDELQTGNTREVKLRRNIFYLSPLFLLPTPPMILYQCKLTVGIMLQGPALPPASMSNSEFLSLS